MELKPEHLKYLVCPVCRGTLTLARESVKCTVCGRHYPLQDGLPVLIATRAILE